MAAAMVGVGRCILHLPVSHAVDVLACGPNMPHVASVCSLPPACGEVTDRRPSTEVIDDDDLGKPLGTRGAREATSSPLTLVRPRSTYTAGVRQ